MKSLLSYFRHSYLEKLSWYYEEEDRVYSYQEIKQALYRVKITDPSNYRNLEMLYSSHGLSCNQIAQLRGRDASTLNRSWEKTIHLVKNYLTYADLVPDLKPINLVQYD